MNAHARVYAQTARAMKKRRYTHNIHVIRICLWYQWAKHALKTKYSFEKKGKCLA